MRLGECWADCVSGARVRTRAANSSRQITGRRHSISTTIPPRFQRLTASPSNVFIYLFVILSRLTIVSSLFISTRSRLLIPSRLRRITFV